MNTPSIEQYVRRRMEVEREIDTWAKVSWGLFFGAITMAAILDQWTSTNASGETILLLGARLGTPIGLALLGAYFWRKRILYKKLHQIWLAMPDHERKIAFESILKS